MLKLLPVTLKEATKDWLKSLPPGAIMTWENLRTKFIRKFSPHSKISKSEKSIANFQQNGGESLYEVWEHYKELL